MKIVESQVTLESARTHRQSRTMEERLDMQWRQPASVTVTLPGDQVELSSEALMELKRPLSQVGQSESVPDANEMKARLVEALLSALSGKPVRIMRLNEEAWAKVAGDSSGRMAAQLAGIEGASGRGFALRYDYRLVTAERESLQLDFAGRVVTEDGKEVDFSLQLSMVRSSYQEESFSLQIGQMVDPLVISFAAPRAALSGQRIAFDLTADGVDEQVPLLAPGSGFLVLDRNGDGLVNDGRELFGTESGNGFADLAQFDLDGNQWIDESDPIFSQLRIWTIDGVDQRLLTLAEQGVGALYLGSVNAQFSLQGVDAELLGKQQRAGLFLREDGTAGTMQHIDLVV